MDTFKFNLPSGPTAEVTALYGEHQEILTKVVKNENPVEKSNRLIVSILKSVVGMDVNLDNVGKMLSCDRRAILAAARQFTFDFENVFDFAYTYKLKGERMTHIEPVELPENGMFPMKLMPVQVSSYAEVVREIDIILPKSGQQVRYNLSDGISERMAAALKESELSSSALLSIRRPRYFYKKDADSNGVYVQLNLSKLHLRDIEFLRSSIKENEGTVDAEISFENPRYNSDEFNEDKERKTIILDMINAPEFFFPSSII